MQTFTLTVLAIYARYPSAPASEINHKLGVPHRIIRQARNFLGQNGYLEKDKNLNWHITELGQKALEQFDREKAREDAKFISESADIICQALDATADQLSGFTLLDKGMTNDSYIFFCKGKKYIYRHAGKGSEMLVDRYREYANYLALKDKGISDVVVYHNPIDGTKITEFIEGSRSIDINNPDDINRALVAVRKLHNADIISPHNFDFLHTIDYYEEICHNSEVEFFSTYRKYKAQIVNLLEKVELLNVPKCFCHIDFVPNNCLMNSDGHVVLIDWEYSGSQDPLVDIAMFCLSAAFTKTQSDKFLNLYLGRKATLTELARFYTYYATAGLMWCLWSQFKTASGEVFEGYTERTYNLCKKYSRHAQKIFSRIEQGEN